MRRSWLFALGLLVGCFAGVRLKKQPEPVPGFAIRALPEYQGWLNEANDCVRRLLLVAPGQLPFALDSAHLVASADDVDWVLIPSERADGSFRCTLDPKLSCYGETIVPVVPRGRATIRLSVQYLRSAWVVKHELMHVFVASPYEWQPGAHNAPWGFCEWL